MLAAVDAAGGGGSGGGFASLELAELELSSSAAEYALLAPNLKPNPDSNPNLSPKRNQP